MSDEHPSPVDRLRVGFATAVDGLNDGTVKAVVVVAITSTGRGCKIWDYGDVPACARVGEAIRGSLYMPETVDASNLNRGIPRVIRPTIEELEAILAEDDRAVEIMPDGSVRVQPTEIVAEVNASSPPVQDS